MTGTRWQHSAELVTEIMSLVAERSTLERQTALESFVFEYFSNVEIEDIEHAEVADWYGAVLSHWNFARQRAPGETRIRAYNPHTQTHGWQSTHSVLEIVCDDRPFLLDSVRMALERQGLTVHLIIHPVMGVGRNDQGMIETVERLTHRARGGSGDAESASPRAGLPAEAIMHLELDRQPEQTLAEVGQIVRAALDDVVAVVDDWPSMVRNIDAVMAALKSGPPPIPATELEEGVEFLSWLRNDHFTFLGYREYRLVDASESDATGALQPVAGSGLGLLRELDGHPPRVLTSLTPEALRIAREPELLIITKSNHRSTVHRPSYLDYIGVKRFDADGKVIGEYRFMGLFTSAAYNRSPMNIPLLANKLRRVLTRSSFAPRGHAEKALLNILETFPRDQLFQLPEEELYETALGILHLEERRRPRVFIHRERFGRFYSALVFVPRERFNTVTRQLIQETLETTLGASGSEFTVSLGESVLARLHFILHVEGEPPLPIDQPALEARLRDLTRSWNDELTANILDYFGEARGVGLVRRYGEAFRADYREDYTPRVAVHDIEHMEALDRSADGLSLAVYRPLEAPPDQLRMKLFHPGSPVSLSDALPMLENMGLRVEDENPAKIKRGDGPRIWMHDFGMRSADGSEVDLEAVRTLFHEAFSQIWVGNVENDGFNRLVIGVGLGWRQVVVLRAYYRYLRQIRLPFSQAYVERALANNAAIVRDLVALFETRFDPTLGDERETRATALVERIGAALDGVASLDEDRILQSYLALIRATTRTNYYQRQSNGRDAEGVPKSYLSFKFDPALVPDMPRPRPMYEIFVYSPRVEGVHLRGGPVARGGLRWSDRAEDFRTEVLGLVKAQMVKNAVIVPVGSKGGF
ncbi:MAG: NAD-glutamate dehydrogenase, partial [Gammaproteobacteria bacterium]|nr:NAD-glutamate dehydrogenase [Gammaproteobacteria bacterium]